MASWQTVTGDDDGQAISYKVVPRGTAVLADGVQVGTVRRAQETGREHIFDGIVIDTKNGQALRRRARGRPHRRAVG